MLSNARNSNEEFVMTTEKTIIPNKASDIKKAADPAAPVKDNIKAGLELTEEDLKNVAGGVVVPPHKVG